MPGGQLQFNGGYRFLVADLLLDYNVYGHRPWFGKTVAAAA